MVTTQAERDARKKPPPPTVADRLWGAAFFGLGALIASSVALAAIDGGSLSLVAVVLGAVAGGLGSWFLFSATYRLLTTIATLTSGRKPIADDDC